MNRERLEANRDRVAKGLSGGGRPSTRAVEGKAGYIPKGYCVAWNKGGCTKDDCPYKHETPKPRERNRKTSKTSGRSTDRSGSPKPKAKGKKICKFWKQGRCDRGADCKFLHEGVLLLAQLAVIPKERRSLPGVPNKRTHAAPVAPRVRRTRDRRNPKGRPPVPRLHLPLCV